MRFRAYFCCFLAILVGVSVVRPSLAADSVVPVEAFSRLPQVRSVRISPNGEYLAYLTCTDGHEFLVTQTVGADDYALLLETDNEKARFRWFRWANDDWLLVSFAFPDLRHGTETSESRLIRVKRTGSAPYLFFKPTMDTKHYSQFQDAVISFLPDDPQHILVQLDDTMATYPAVYKVDVETGAKRRILLHRLPIRAWMVDQQDRVRLGFGYDDGVSSVIAREAGKRRWKELWSHETIDEAGTEVMGFGADPNTLFVRAIHEGRNAIFSLDLADPGLPRKLLAHDPNYDIDGDLIYSPKTRDVVGVYDRGADGSRIYWDEGYKTLQSGIDIALPDTTNLLGTLSRDERHYVVFASSDVNPGVFYYGDRDQGSLLPFADAYPELSGMPLSGKQSVEYPARDGLVIEGYLTRPWGERPQPWPAVVLPHGGPSARDYADFDFLTEFLASRGYAVLQMNFRGSSGYGWDFMRSGFKDLGGRMQDDVTDGARWMVEQGFADPGRMCIMGASYGGYAALWGVVKTPDLYRCAISLNGVSDWGVVFADSQSYVHGETTRKQLGDRADLKQVSPLRRAGEIRVPVLLVHGNKDRIVPVKHSRKMAKELKKHHKVYRYIELENGVHSLTNERNRTQFLKAVETFLAEHLSYVAPATTGRVWSPSHGLPSWSTRANVAVPHLPLLRQTTPKSSPPQAMSSGVAVKLAGTEGGAAI